jgi:hypothetical protein
VALRRREVAAAGAAELAWLGLGLWRTKALPLHRPTPQMCYSLGRAWSLALEPPPAPRRHLGALIDPTFRALREATWLTG